MSDDIFNLDDFVSQEPVAKKQAAPDDYDNSEFTMEPAVVVKEVAVAGTDGTDGTDGLDGAKGADGIGIDGAKGLDGSNGSDGVSVIDTFVQGGDLFIRLSDGKLINAGDVRGPQGLQGPQGSGGGKGYRGGGNNTKSANHFGFADYNDTSTATTPLTIVGETWTTLPNNGAGSFSQERLPLLLSNTLLGAGGSLDVSEMALGSDLLIRPDFTVTPSANNSALSFRFQLGAGAGAYTLEQQLGRLDLGAGIPYRFSLQALYVYLGDTNTRDNPISLQIKLSGNGSAVNAGLALKVYSL
tara:strand:- start:672 stop:1565 length:894 start_codon:yes stop_codon:yes gene_type:complete